MRHDECLHLRNQRRTVTTFFICHSPAFNDFVVGGLSAASGRKMRFSGITVLKIKDGKIGEGVGLDDGLTAMQQLGIVQPT